MTWSQFISPGAKRSHSSCGFAQQSRLAKESIELSFEFVLEENWGYTEEGKDDEQGHSLRGYGVHGGGELLKGGASLNEDERRWRHSEERTHPKREEGDPNDRGDNVDEPVGKERSDPEEGDVRE